MWMWRVRGWWSGPGLLVVWPNARVVVRDRPAFIKFTNGGRLICRSTGAAWWCGSARRLYCPTQGCRRTFREQVPGVLERYQRRTTRLTGHVRATVREPAGRASVRMLRRWSVRLSRRTAVRVLLGIPLQTQVVPRVLGVDDFALLRRHRYGTVLIDGATHQRVDVLPDRRSTTLETWLRGHPGVEFVVRDGSATYAEAIRRGVPTAIRIADRRHLWHHLVRAAEKVVAAHARCWAAAGPKRRQLTRETTTPARWHAIHDLLDHGVGLMDCARRLGLGLNTVKRYSRVSEPENSDNNALARQP